MLRILPPPPTLPYLNVIDSYGKTLKVDAILKIHYLYKNVYCNEFLNFGAV